MMVGGKIRKGELRERWRGGGMRGSRWRFGDRDGDDGEEERVCSKGVRGRGLYGTEPLDE